MHRLLVTASAVPSSLVLVTLMKEGLSSSETSVLTRATRRNIPEDTILYIIIVRFCIWSDYWSTSLHAYRYSYHQPSPQVLKINQSHFFFLLGWLRSSSFWPSILPFFSLPQKHRAVTYLPLACHPLLPHDFPFLQFLERKTSLSMGGDMRAVWVLPSVSEVGFKILFQSRLSRLCLGSLFRLLMVRGPLVVTVM
jgi:hypothetical protein